MCVCVCVCACVREGGGAELREQKPAYGTEKSITHDLLITKNDAAN